MNIFLFETKKKGLILKNTRKNELIIYLIF